MKSPPPTNTSDNSLRAILASIVESSDDAIISKTLDGMITSWNAGARKIFGYTAEEAVGKSILMLIPSDRVAEEQEILARLRRNERIEHYETVRIHKDGTPISVSLTVSPVLDSTGQVVGASKIARDITERKSLEADNRALLMREQETRRAAETLNELAHTLGAELDLQKLVQKVTDAGRELTNAEFSAFFYNNADAEGESYLLFTLSGAPRESFEQFGMPRNTDLFAPTFRGERIVRIADVQQDSRFGKNAPHFGLPKGHLPVRSYMAVPVFSRFGAVLGGLFFGHTHVGVFNDRAEALARGLASQAGVAIDNAHLFQKAQNEITERRRAEDRERAARQSAERAARLRDEFLATVSHELRTPLNGVLGWTQLLRRLPDDEETRAQGLEAIERGARAQARLIDDLLDMSRIISGKLRLEVQSVELVSVVEAAIETIRPTADAKQIRLENILDPRAGPVRGDPARLEQVLWNLLSNAVKFTPSNGRVQVHLERINSHVEVSVSDTGKGISPEFLPSVFDRFSQADGSTTRHHGGLGLGLAVAKHLVELHGGKILVKSPGEGLGSTFVVHLPIAVLQKDRQNRQYPAGSISPELFTLEVNLQNVHVLVVDDDTDSVKMLARVLADCGANVQTASSAKAALEQLSLSKFDVVISDIGMPEMDGYDLIREMRLTDRRTPAVAVTAFARAEDRIKALKAGYNMHVAKPLEPSELIQVVATLTDSQRGDSVPAIRP